jgi:hypothetical protein
MTDESPNTAPATPAAKKRSWFLPIALVIVLLAVVAFVISRAGIDKALVKQKIDDVIAQIKQNGRAQGRDIDITYGDLDVVGSFAHKHVVIHNPSLSVKPLNQKPLAPGEMAKSDSLVVTTPEIEIYPESADLSALRVEAAQPINFAAQDAPEKSLMKVTGNTPFTVSFAQENMQGVPYTNVEYISPTETDCTYLREQQATGAEEQTPSLAPIYDTLHVVVAPGSGIESHFAADGSQLGHANIHYNDVVMAPKSAPDGMVNITAIKGEWSNVLNEKKQNVIHNTFAMGPITAGKDLLPIAPVSLNLDVSYTGATLKTPESVAALKSEQSSIDVKTFTLTTKDASINVTASFVADASDVLPVGTANIAIVNMPFFLTQLRTYALLNPANEGIVDPMLQLMTGSPVEQLKDTTIAVERQRGGSFKIGQTTFEELFATFLKQAMRQKQGQALTPSAAGAPATIVPAGGVIVPVPAPNSHAPVLPPADKPKSKPIAVPDLGTRG